MLTAPTNLQNRIRKRDTEYGCRCNASSTGSFNRNHLQQLPANTQDQRECKQQATTCSQHARTCGTALESTVLTMDAGAIPAPAAASSATSCSRDAGHQRLNKQGWRAIRVCKLSKSSTTQLEVWRRRIPAAEVTRRRQTPASGSKCNIRLFQILNLRLAVCTPSGSVHAQRQRLSWKRNELGVNSDT